MVETLRPWSARSRSRQALPGRRSRLMLDNRLYIILAGQITGEFIYPFSGMNQSNLWRQHALHVAPFLCIRNNYRPVSIPIKLTKCTININPVAMQASAIIIHGTIRGFNLSCLAKLRLKAMMPRLAIIARAISV